MHFAGKTATGKLDWLEVLGRKGSGPRQRDSDAAEQGRPGGGPNAEARQPGLRGPRVPWSREQPGQSEASSQAPAPG